MKLTAPDLQSQSAHVEDPSSYTVDIIDYYENTRHLNLQMKY